jgi:hypothetical protein
MLNLRGGKKNAAKWKTEVISNIEIYNILKKCDEKN